MTGAIVEAKQAAIQWNDEQVKTILATVAKDASKDELSMFLHLSQTYGLDPFAKEIWFIKMGGRPTIMTSRDGYLKIANNHPDFEGLVSDVVYEGDSFQKTPDGVNHAYGVNKRGGIVGAYALVYRKGIRFPVYVFAPFKDYNRGRDTWAQYPHAMILKVAESMSLKRAFSLSGLVTREELDVQDSTDAVPAQAKRKLTKKEFEATKQRVWNGYVEICDGQEVHAKNAIKKLVDKPSKEWTEADLEILEADLLRRYRERDASAQPCESVRDTIIDVDFAEEKGIGPDPVQEATDPEMTHKTFSELEQLREKLADGLSIRGTQAEGEAWLATHFGKALKALSKEELRAALNKLNAELDADEGI